MRSGPDSPVVSGHTQQPELQLRSEIHMPVTPWNSLLQHRQQVRLHKSYQELSVAYNSLV